MKPRQRDAVLLKLMAELLSHGSWCGETHIQKACYLLQELVGDDLGFEFVLYKHGPYSFDLSDALTALQADLLVDLKLQQGYGPTLLVTESGVAHMDRWPRTVAEHAKAIEFVAGVLRNRGVAELERLATALLVTREIPQASPDDRARRINQLKPHVTLLSARQAIDEIDQLVPTAEQLRAA